jgi:hypothetical protein
LYFDNQIQVQSLILCINVWKTPFFIKLQN